jgi:hypothetical protein
MHTKGFMKLKAESIAQALSKASKIVPTSDIVAISLMRAVKDGDVEITSVLKSGDIDNE